MSKVSPLYFVPLLLILSFGLKFSGQPNVDDPFHTGEFLASATNLSFGDPEAYRAIQIHGLSDILPALLAQAVWGTDHHFVPTLAAYRLVDWLSYVLLVFAALQVSQGERHRLIYVLITAAIGLNLVGFRDLGILLTLNLYLLAVSLVYGGVAKNTLYISYGMVAALAMFWSFDRGIVGTIAFGAASLIASRSSRAHILSMVMFGVTVVCLHFYNDIFSLEKYVDNVLILITASSQWSYGWSLNTAVLVVFSLGLNVGSLCLYCLSRRAELKYPAAIRDLVLYLLLAALMFRIAGINRVDLHHIYQSFWVPLLILASMPGQFRAPQMMLDHKEAFVFLIFLAGLLVVLVPVFGPVPYVTLAVLCAVGLGFFSALDEFGAQRIRQFSFILLLIIALHPAIVVARSVYQDAYAWLSTLNSPPPNSEIATPGVRWAAQMLRKSGAHCIFDLSNNGVINSLAKLPVCTKFTYPVYASRSHESSLISQLQQNSPAAIVYSSEYWSYRIDGRSMASRFPALDQYLLNHYSREVCEHGYCVRYLDAVAPDGAAEDGGERPQTVT